jgi:hypothetical protein
MATSRKQQRWRASISKMAVKAWENPDKAGIDYLSEPFLTLRFAGQKSFDILGASYCFDGSSPRLSHI